MHSHYFSWLRASLLLLLLLLLLTYASSRAQLVQREGWPQYYNPVTIVENDHNISIIMENENPVIGVASGTGICLLDINGNFLPGWPVNIENSWLISQGPILSNIEGDDDYEVFVVARNWDMTQRKSFILNSNGNILPEHSYEHDLASSVSSSIATCDVNLDGYNEYFYVADSLYGFGQQGVSLPGFPLDLRGVPNAFGGIAVGYWTGLEHPFIVWLTTEAIHMRWVDTGEEAPGWPIEVPIPHGDYVETCSSPMIIPESDGWLIAFSTRDSLYVWHESGDVKEGFPIGYQWVRESAWMSEFSVANMDSDDAAEFVVRMVNDTIDFIDDDGTLIDGLGLETTGMSGTPASCYRLPGDTTSYTIYCGLEFDEGNWSHSIYEMYGYSLQPGYPLAEPNFVDPSRACNALCVTDDTLHVVLHHTNGAINVRDIPLHGQEVKFEWPMPGGNSDGNRMYQPTEWLNAVPENGDKGTAVYTDSVEVTAYPNPSNGIVTISFNAMDLRVIGIKIYNLLGKLIEHKVIEQSATQSYIFQWDTQFNTISSGMYFAEVELEGGRCVTTRISIAK